MTKKLVQLKRSYYFYLDTKARNFARKLSRRLAVTELILNCIKELYSSAKSESRFSKSDKFEIAYHNPITSDLEFLIARILYHYSNSKKLNWTIYLRRQVGKTAPDIRIEREGRTIGIIEVKAKAGWIQPVFSKERVRKDMIKLKQGKSDYDPLVAIKKLKKQVVKYSKTYDIKPKQVYILLPSLIHVHRKKSERQVKDYENDFSDHLGLPKHNLILLSNNLSLDLSLNPSRREYSPSKKFEDFISTLRK